MNSKNKASKKEKAQKPTGYVQKNERVRQKNTQDDTVKERINSEEPENPTDKTANDQ